VPTASRAIDKTVFIRYIYTTRMKMIAPDPAQTTQRVKVGIIGLAAVLLLIGLAAAIFSTVSKEKPLTVAGGARADVVANMVSGNDAAPAETPTSEPLAELGVAPSTAAEDVNVAQVARHRQAKSVPADR
jgi:hypothetical protein